LNKGLVQFTWEHPDVSGGSRVRAPYSPPRRSWQLTVVSWQWKQENERGLQQEKSQNKEQQARCFFAERQKN